LFVSHNVGIIAQVLAYNLGLCGLIGRC
jgi:hypothetical protein